MDMDDIASGDDACTRNDRDRCEHEDKRDRDQSVHKESDTATLKNLVAQARSFLRRFSRLMRFLCHFQRICCCFFHRREDRFISREGPSVVL